MSIIVTLDMYSGLSNPSWELSDNDAKAFAELLSKKRNLSGVTAPIDSARFIRESPSLNCS
ncbi:MAG: hypothetical protein Q8R74_02745 [Methylophilus sp.]|nr:hypothetical protein [Methylophilus sp.]